MRPAMMLLLRGLVILGAVLAVISCSFTAPLAPRSSEALWATPGPETCTRLTFSQTGASMPAVSAMITISGTGLCW